MDVRDLAFWFKEAQKKLVLEQIKRIQASRLGMADDNSYRTVIAGLEMQIKELEIGREKAIRQNWLDLKKIGRG